MVAASQRLSRYRNAATRWFERPFRGTLGFGPSDMKQKNIWRADDAPYLPAIALPEDRFAKLVTCPDNGDKEMHPSYRDSRGLVSVITKNRHEATVRRKRHFLFWVKNEKAWCLSFWCGAILGKGGKND